MTEKAKDIDYNLILRWRRKETSPAETEQAENWLQEARLSDEQFQELMCSCAVAEQFDNMKAVDTPNALSKINSRIQAADRQALQAKSKRLWRWRAFAASVLLVFGAMLFLFFGNRQKDACVAWTMLETEANEQVEYSLPDGSKVLLNANTRLAFASDFKVKRLLKLEGEAFFEVESDKEHPFEVSAGSLVVQAVGTAFNVMAYAQAKKIETTLVEGKVNLLKRSEEKNERLGSMFPGEISEFDEVERSLKIESGFSRNRLGWISGQMVLKNDLLEDVLLRMECLNDVKFVMPEALKKRYRLNGTFEEESMREILEVIELSVPVRFSFENFEGKRIIQIKAAERQQNN